jgi:hypothetical protein
MTEEIREQRPSQKETLHILPKPVVLVSGNVNYLNPYSFDEILDRKVNALDALRGYGYDVRMLSGIGPNRDSLQLQDFTNAVEKQRSGQVIQIPIEKDWDTFLLTWPRDVFQVYGDTVFTPADREKLTKHIFNNLGAPDAKIKTSALGEGGLVVRSGNVVVLPERLQNLQEIRELEKLGYDLNFLPVPIQTDPVDTDLRLRMDNGHIDTEFNLIQAPNNKYLMAVNELYYKNYTAAVDSLRNKLDAKLHVIKSPNEQTYYRGVNFIELPNRKAALPRDCYSTKKFLEDELGQGNVISLDIDPDTDFRAGGGLRCHSVIAT